MGENEYQVAQNPTYLNLIEELADCFLFSKVCLHAYSFLHRMGSCKALKESVLVAEVLLWLTKTVQ